MMNFVHVYKQVVSWRLTNAIISILLNIFCNYYWNLVLQLLYFGLFFFTIKNCLFFAKSKIGILCMSIIWI